MTPHDARSPTRELSNKRQNPVAAVPTPETAPFAPPASQGRALPPGGRRGRRRRRRGGGVRAVRLCLALAVVRESGAGDEVITSIAGQRLQSGAPWTVSPRASARRTRSASWNPTGKRTLSHSRNRRRTGKFANDETTRQTPRFEGLKGSVVPSARLFRRSLRRRLGGLAATVNRPL